MIMSRLATVCREASELDRFAEAFRADARFLFNLSIITNFYMFLMFIKSHFSFILAYCYVIITSLFIITTYYYSNNGSIITY